MKIAIIGRSGAGKDTFADYLVKNKDFKKMAFAEPLYEMAINYFGMEKKDRYLLQDIGNAMREVRERVFVDLLKKRILEEKGNIIVTDVRQLNEFNMLKELCFDFVNINCSLENRAKRIAKRDNIVVTKKYIKAMEENKSETGCDKVKKSDFVYQVDNNGTIKDLEKEVYRVYNEILNKNSMDFETKENTEIVADMLEKKYTKKDKRIFLSGAITDRKETYKKYFNTAYDVLTKRGFDVFNPALISSDTSWEESMKRTITELMKSDIVYVLRDFEYSKGVKVELELANGLAIPVYFEKNSDNELEVLVDNMVNELKSIKLTEEGLIEYFRKLEENGFSYENYLNKYIEITGNTKEEFDAFFNFLLINRIMR